MWLICYIVIRTVVSIIGSDVFNNIFAYYQKIIVKGLRRIMIVSYSFQSLMSISFLFDNVPSCFNFVCGFVNLIIIDILFCFFYNISQNFAVLLVVFLNEVSLLLLVHKQRSLLCLQEVLIPGIIQGVWLCLFMSLRCGK